ncbi:acetyl-CoA carboxylase biotin carboxyl carrier protein [Candidatus Marithrix sp. Canyon 246]|uniref:acetyl-CoA carboxylase biotin carboxyl carrier protein n=1 Tax=Candidatus Marithrix sp. Canyon 246 TaxID=1827136 RepID=UPI000849F5F8|nr:acetyl-CoA carboxylase biotin carboxyl carrier protein [Candidatus Marithrix sp. Canyon 246]
MDINHIKQLIELVEASEISEIEINEGEDSIRISRYSNVVAPVAPVAPVAAPVQQEVSIPAPPKSNELTGHIIKSPMVGTFYEAASPTSKPFVKEGQTVKEGETLCIIEAMKILNQITADKSGVVTKILVDNGAPVEYDENLFVIE